MRVQDIDGLLEWSSVQRSLPENGLYVVCTSGWQTKGCVYMAQGAVKFKLVFSSRWNGKELFYTVEFQGKTLFFR